MTNADATAALERAGCECDPTDLRPDLARAIPGALYVYVENHQNPLEQDPDYNIWSYVLMQDGRVLVTEHKNTWKVEGDLI